MLGYPLFHLFNKQRVSRCKVLCAMIGSPTFAAFGAHTTGGPATFFKKLDVMAKLGESNGTAKACEAGTNNRDRLVNHFISALA